MKYFSPRYKKGFTLIELLVVIAIIALLSSIILASINTARAKARDAKRKSDLRQLQIALELYRNDHGQYPVTYNDPTAPYISGVWWGIGHSSGLRPTSGPDAYIPGLAPQYITELPIDPLGPGNIANYSGYLYRSDGVNYKILSHSNGPEWMPAPGTYYYDPFRTDPQRSWKVCNVDRIYTERVPGDPCSEW